MSFITRVSALMAGRSLKESNKNNEHKNVECASTDEHFYDTFEKVAMVVLVILLVVVLVVFY